MSNSFESYTLTSCLEGDDDIPAIIVTDNGPIYNRKCLREKVLELVLSLSRIGVKRGDNVALSFANDVEFVVLFFAIASLGASAAPLNPSYKTEEVIFYLQDINASLLLIPKNKQNKEAEAAADKMNVPIVYTELDAVSKSINLSFAKEANQEITYNNNSSEAFPDDIALFLHTSGTTGKPKGVPLSHINMLATMQNITDTYKLTKEDRGYLVMPLFHVHGLMAGVFAPLFARGSIVIPNHSQGFQAHLLWSDIAKYECNWFTAVPTMHQSLLSNLHHYDAAGKPVLRFIRSCSSSLPPSVLVQLEEVFRSPVLEAYAMTEACHQMTSNPLPGEDGTIRRKPGSVGRPVNVELKILDTNNNNNEFAANTVGEVCVKAKNVTKGYHNREDANKEAFTTCGFFRTGDLGYLDDNGFLFLTGRIKEQINRGGEKLAPVTIDNVLLQCPGVSSLFAFGTPHSELGETVAVVVVVQSSTDTTTTITEPLTLQKLNAFGFDHGLAPQWLPSVIVFCDSVPKGPTGKVQRTKLSSLLGLPILSAADGPSIFRFRSGEALERLSTSSENTRSYYGGDDVNRAEVENVVGDIIGMDLSQREELVLDSFTAVTLSSSLNSRYGSTLKPKDCLSTTISAIEVTLRTAVSLRLENVVKLVESVLGISVSHRLDEPLPLDSFSAVQLSSSLKHNYKVNISPQQIVGNQFSMKELQQTITKSLLTDGERNDVNDQVTSPDFFDSQATVPISTLEFLRTATASVVEVAETTTTKSVLLTGATGFLGIHLLDALLGYSEVSKVICLVRSKDNENGLSRILQQWNSQGITSPLDTSRVVVITGDTSVEGWGLQQYDLDTLYSSNVFAIIHNSAFVNHALPYQELFDANVRSTQSAITLAAKLSIYNKYYCHCAYVSTGGVCGRLSFKDEEEPLRLPAESLLKQNGYVQGKWVSERLVENAAVFLSENNVISHNLVTNPAFSIFRPGALTGHSETGACNIGDSINRYLIGWSLLAAAPPLASLDTSVQVDMSPVDWNAKAIAGIILQNCNVVIGPGKQNNKLCPVYTLDNGNSKSYNNLIESISNVSRKSIKLTESYEEWLDIFTTSLEKENTNHEVYPNPLRDLLGSLKRKPPKFGSTSCSKHGELLERYGFPWPIITEEYINICFQKYNNLGAIPPI